MSAVATPAPVKKEQTSGTPTAADNQKGIDNHKDAAKHHVEAAKHHTDAAKHHEDGNHDKAAASTVKAHGHHALATDHLHADSKQHAAHA